MAITQADFNKIWASTSPLTPYEFSESNYKEGWNFIGATPPSRQMWDSLQRANDEKFKFLRDNFGTPNMVTTAAQMTDTDKIYVYVGSEAGWSNGHWYYYDAGTSTWVDGGVYNSTAFVTDTTLTVAGKAADAKAVGDALALKADLAGATFSGNVAVNADFSTTGDATVGGDLTVSGVTTLTGNVTANGNISVVGDIDADNITLNGDIDATDVTASGDVTANDASFANATLSGTLTVSGATTLDGLTVGSVSAQSLNTTGNASVGGTLTVSGATTLDSVTADDITASGDITADDITANTLTVSGVSTLSGNVTAGADVTVTSDLSVTNITASGDITADDVTANGNLSVVGNATLSGTSTAVTPAAEDNSTKIATTAYVQTEIKPIETDVTINEKRISNIEKLLEGNLYDYQTDTDSAYTKTVLAGAMPYASLEQIGGKTVVWNQLLENGNFADATGWTTSTGTTMSVANNVLTATATTSSYATVRKSSAYTVPLINGHKYYITAVVSSTSGILNAVPFNSVSAGSFAINNATSPTRFEWLYTSTQTNNASMDIRLVASVNGTEETITATVSNYMYVDLTLMYGSGNEPSTVQEFQQMFPAQYYSYNAGTLLSAGVTEVVSKKADTTEIATYPIPAEIQALEGYGWSAGTAYNYVDFERKVFVKRVGAVDLGTLSWTYGYNRFSADVPNINTSTTARLDGLTCIYPIDTNSYIDENMSDKTCKRYAGKVLIKDSAYTTTSAFTSAMSGVYLYYELATPQEIDISQYLTDDNLISVEAGGSLTFPNQHGDDYRIDVPSSETYMVDLQASL